MALPIRNNSRRVKPFDICPPSRGFAPRTPRHALSLAPSRLAPLRWLARYARSRSLGLRPSDSPTRSLARRFAPRSARVAHSLRSFASRGASPLGLPYTLSRSPLRRLAPVAWLTRCARSLLLRGLAPRTPLHASLARPASPLAPLSLARSRGSFALSPARLRPSDSPTASLARPASPLAPLRWLAHFARSLLAAGFAPRAPPTRERSGASGPRERRQGSPRGEAPEQKDERQRASPGAERGWGPRERPRGGPEGRHQEKRATERATGAERGVGPPRASGEGGPGAKPRRKRATAQLARERSGASGPRERGDGGSGAKPRGTRRAHRVRASPERSGAWGPRERRV